MLYLYIDVAVDLVVALFRLLGLVAGPDVAEDPLDAAVVRVQPHQLIRDLRVDEVYVKRLVPVDEHVLLTEQSQALQPVVRAERTDALVQ